MNKILGKTTLLRVLTGLALMGMFSAAQAQTDNVNVQLTLNSSQTELDITTRGNCSDNNQNGCVEVGKNRKARSNFSFTGGRKCDQQEGARWNLDEVYLGGKNSTSKPRSWGNLDSEVQADFNVADASSGLLNKEGGSNDQSIIIFDQNNYAYDIWSLVTAVCVAENGSRLAVIESDPRIKNGGAD